MRRRNAQHSSRTDPSTSTAGCTDGSPPVPFESRGKELPSSGRVGNRRDREVVRGCPRTTSSLLRGVRQLPYLCLDQPRSPAADPAGVLHGVALPNQVHRLLQTPAGPGWSHKADGHRTIRSTHSNRITQAPTRSSHAEPFRFLRKPGPIVTPLAG